MRTIMTLLVALTAAAMLAGCSEAKSHQDSRQLLEEVRQAQDLYAQAMGLMSSPVFRVLGREAPFTKPLAGPLPRDAKQVEPATDLAAHPEVPRLLAEAEKSLRAAASKYDKALPADQALAQCVLGQINLLRGQYHQRLGEPDRQQAALGIDTVGSTASLLDTYARQAAFLAGMEQLDQTQIRHALLEAQKGQEELSQKAKAIGQQVQQLRQQHDELYQKSTELAPQARQLRVDSQLATGPKALDLAEQALKIELQIGRNELEAAGLEFREELLANQLAQLQTEASSLAGREQLAQTMLGNIEQGQQSRRQALQEHRQQITVLDKQLAADLTGLSESLANLSRQQQEAAKAYQAAVTAGKQAVAKRAGNASSLAQQAASHMAMGELQARQLRMGRQIAALSQKIAQARSTAAAALPAETATPLAAPVALEYPPTPPDELDQQAQESYRQAAQLYQKATGGVAGPNKWAYQGQQAAAYLSLYRLSGQREDLDLARQLLSTALEGREASPNLTAVRELNQTAGEMEERAPAAATAPADEAAEESPAAEATQAGSEDEGAPGEAATATAPAEPMVPPGEDGSQ